MATINGTNEEDVLSSEELTGGDSLVGLAGDDVYYSDSIKDKIIEGANAGYDRVNLNADFDFAGAYSYTLANNVERLDISQVSLNDMLHDPDNFEKFTTNGIAINGNASDNYIKGNGEYGQYIKIFGGAGNDTIVNDVMENETDDYFDGGIGNDTLKGGGGNNTLIGGAGNDLLQSSSTGDYLDGGTGDDTYYFGNNAPATVTDASGIDTIQLGSGFWDTSLNLRTIGDGQIENVDATNAGAASLEITGTSSANVIIGQSNVVNTISGLGGNDTITGGADADNLNGGDGNDYLDGNSAGVADRLVGGDGNDTYVVNDTDDIITELDGLAGGVDTLKISANYSSKASFDLADYPNIENIDASAYTSGSLGLTGTSANNSIIGTSNDDIIDGKGGRDTLTGGLGNDTYVLNSLNDVIVETNAEAVSTLDGTTGDTINVDSYSLLTAGASYTMAQNTENFNLTFSFDPADHPEMTDEYLAELAVNKFVVKGNASANYISTHDYGSYVKAFGGNGNDVMIGYAGNDYFEGGSGNDYLCGDSTGSIGGESDTQGSSDDTLIGGAGNDTIYGNGGNDFIDGGAGNDTIYGGSGTNSLVGGVGNDTYWLYSPSGDNISDVSGNDTIILSSVNTFTATDNNLNLANIAGGKIENIDASSYDANTSLTIIGSSVSNKLTGSATHANTISGGAGNDTIYGGALSDSLNGGDGNDIIYSVNGGPGDTLVGGSGNDTYVVDSASDGITELANGGTDTIKLYNISNYTLADDSNIEILDGSLVPANFVLKGNSSNNILIGNSGDDLLSGAAGNDTLYGGNGNDTLDGGAGADVMIGGAGNDTYYLNSSVDRIVESAGAGVDTVILGDKSLLVPTPYVNAPKSFSYTLGVNLENIVYTPLSDATTSYALYGNNSNNNISMKDIEDKISSSAKIYGYGGDDIISILVKENGTGFVDGGTGNDTISVGSIGNFTLVGGVGDDTIYAGGTTCNVDGGKGNDLLIDAAGDYTFTGGVGNDTFSFGISGGHDLITSTDAGDVISFSTEAQNDNASPTGTTHLATSDMLFYTDSKGDLHINYADENTVLKNGLLDNVILADNDVEIVKGMWNKSTTVQVGDATININSIIQNISAMSGLTGLTDAQIGNLTFASNDSQVTALAAAWVHQ